MVASCADTGFEAGGGGGWSRFGGKGSVYASEPLILGCICHTQAEKSIIKLEGGLELRKDGGQQGRERVRAARATGTIQEGLGCETGREPRTEAWRTATSKGHV